ncbi:globin domain-containing protein [Acidimangrovimonas sediminis]|uniref:globin domain-containing protein n=1 Tax=Acidimangrovimonas sediminis TaxID=2056283 RepID=UPI001304AF5E|nr:globin domain-containing protein [Acidimangrovimonas sediminis]
MKLSAREVQVIRDNFRAVQDRIVPASLEFYEALFRRRPDLRPMFREDLTGQGMKFMSTLEAVVDSLESPEAIADRMEELGHSHAALGVKAEHFVPMGEALIETLRKYVGEGWTAEADAAWRKAYDEVAGRMLAGKG